LLKRRFLQKSSKIYFSEIQQNWNLEKFRNNFFWLFSFFFLLEQKETKIQGERPISILFSLKKSSQYRRKNCNSLSFAKNSRTITNVWETQF